MRFTPRDDPTHVMELSSEWTVWLWADDDSSDSDGWHRLDGPAGISTNRNGIELFVYLFGHRFEWE